MSQFRQRFQSPSSRSPYKDAEVKLRMQGSSYSSDAPDSPYVRRQIENQHIKNLSFWDNTDPEGQEDSEWAERQSPMPFILAIIILVVVSTVLWFMFRWVTGDNANTPPIIAADTAPFKVRPENPGGMMIPHQDKLIYGRLSQDTPQPVERLLPPPEQPMINPPSSMNVAQLMEPQANAAQMPAPTMNSQPNIVNQPQQSYPQPQGYMSQQQGYAPPQPMPQGMQQQAQVTAQPPQSYHPSQGQGQYSQQQPIQGQGPNQMPMHAQPAYGPAPGMPNNQQPHSPQIPLQTASNPVLPKQLSPVENIKPASDEDEKNESHSKDESPTYDSQSELEKLIAKEAETPLKKAPKKNDKKIPKATPVDAGKYKIQIASLPSRSMAEQEMKRLHSQHSSIFQNKPWNIQRVNLGNDRGHTHRLVVGSFPNQNAAAKFCKKLRSEKIGCVVIAPVKE
jgi:hypothetical protein